MASSPINKNANKFISTSPIKKKSPQCKGTEFVVDGKAAVGALQSRPDYGQLTDAELFLYNTSMQGGRSLNGAADEALIGLTFKNSPKCVACPCALPHAL